jgi:hypothetical protein
MNFFSFLSDRIKRANRQEKPDLLVVFNSIQQNKKENNENLIRLKRLS